MNKRIDVIGVECDLGASKRGVSMGPMAIRYAGLCEGIEGLGYEVREKEDIVQGKPSETVSNMRNFETVKKVASDLYDSVSETFATNGFPVIVGGDHSIAAGSISATAKAYKKIGIIWIDAHGDWNSNLSSPSGNMHGMPFSAVCGFGPNEMVDYGQDPVFVDVKNCVQIGGRDIDTLERDRMKEAGVTVFPIDDIDRYGMAEIMSRAIEIAGGGTEGIHLSFDVDAITPEAAPGTGTQVHSGLTVREAFLAVEILAKSQKLLAVDMVEVNPILDERNKTAILAVELILSALGKAVF